MNQERIFEDIQKSSRRFRERVEKQPGPMKSSPTEVLRAEYAEGLEQSGQWGAALCRAGISVADEVGVDVESIVSGFREERHRQILEHSLSCAELVNHLPSKAEVPAPPLPRPPKIRAEEDEQPPPKKGFDRKTNTIQPSPPPRHW